MVWKVHHKGFNEWNFQSIRVRAAYTCVEFVSLTLNSPTGAVHHSKFSQKETQFITMYKRMWDQTLGHVLTPSRLWC